MLSIKKSYPNQKHLNSWKKEIGKSLLLQGLIFTQGTNQTKHSHVSTGKIPLQDKEIPGQNINWQSRRVLISMHGICFHKYTYEINFLHKKEGCYRNYLIFVRFQIHIFGQRNKSEVLTEESILKGVC